MRYADGELYGTLCAASDRPAPVSEEATRVVTLFALLISRQVERERLLEALRSENQDLLAHAMTDTLTGVPNRRALLQEMRRALARARRDGTAVHVAFVDLDGFKAINDQHGHQAGDRFLCSIARALGDGLRRSDFLARIGGDEFVVLAPARSGTDGSGAQELGRKIERLTTGRFDLEGVSLDYGGPSVGVVTSEPGELDAEALLARADAAMYEVKRARRTNR